MVDRSQDVEHRIMGPLGIEDPNWCEGSGRCASFRRQTLAELESRMAAEGLTLSVEWAQMVRKADFADTTNAGSESIRNTNATVINAIHDAMYRKDGKPGIVPNEKSFSFLDGGKRQYYSHLVRSLS